MFETEINDGKLKFMARAWPIWYLGGKMFKLPFWKIVSIQKVYVVLSGCALNIQEYDSTTWKKSFPPCGNSFRLAYLFIDLPFLLANNLVVFFSNFPSHYLSYSKKNCPVKHEKWLKLGSGAKEEEVRALKTCQWRWKRDFNKSTCKYSGK